MRTFYDDPQLIKDINDHIADFLIALYDPILVELGGECAMISEDMCYSGGCSISAAMVREFILPYWKRLTGFFRDHGVQTVLVDSDGDVFDLVPLLIEGGITGLYPFEQTGHDVREVRGSFPRFQILGGLDKRKIALGKAATDEELEAKVPLLLQTGGFVPFIDHMVPSQISWDDFLYYRRRLAELARQ